jgi:hypothetical protein
MQMKRGTPNHRGSQELRRDSRLASPSKRGWKASQPASKETRERGRGTRRATTAGATLRLQSPKGSRTCWRYPRADNIGPRTGRQNQPKKHPETSHEAVAPRNEVAPSLQGCRPSHLRTMSRLSPQGRRPRTNDSRVNMAHALPAGYLIRLGYESPIPNSVFLFL